MSGANFASLHGGMLQRSDLPAEKAANPEKVSTPDGIYGATGIAHHLSDEIAAKKVIGVSRRDALPPKADDPGKPKRIPTKAFDASADLSKQPAKFAKLSDGLPPVSKSKGPLQEPAAESKSSRLVRALRGVPATHLGTPDDTEDTNHPVDDEREKTGLPFKRGFGHLRTNNQVRGNTAESENHDSAPASTAPKDTSPEAMPPAGVLTAHEKIKRKALTVRLLPSEYIRLKRAGAFLDRTSQDILVSAMDEYLKQLGFTHEK